MERHYRDWEMLAFLDDNEAAVGDLAAMRAHVSGCAVCAGQIDDLSYWMQIMSDPATWRYVPEMHQLDVSAMVVLATERNADEAAGRARVEAFPRERLSRWEDLVRATPPTSGFVRALIDHARTLLDSEPPQALWVLGLASTVLDQLSPPPDALRGDICKEKANALRHLGRLNEALRFLDEAELAYSRLPVSEYDRALVTWARATVYFEMKRFAQARVTLKDAAKVFHEFHDEASLAQVVVLEAGIAFDEGAIADARELFAGAVPTLIELNDRETLARVYANLATCDVRLDRANTAREFGSLAATMYETLGMTAEANRLFWSLGQALVAFGKEDEAMLYMEDAANRFAAAGMMLDAAAVNLDRVEVLLRQGNSVHAAKIAAQCLALFRQEGADVDAAHALAYFHEAILASRATPALAGYVREYLQHLSDPNERATFQPPETPLQ